MHGDNNTYKTDPADVLRLSVENNGVTDETAIRFSSQATTNFDSDYDAVKMFSENSDLAQIYSLVNNEEYAINTLPPPLTGISLPLGFKTSNDSKYKITASGLTTFKDNINITLEDLYENILIDLKQQNSYTFNSNATASADRFVVHFNMISSNSNQNNLSENKTVSIYSFNNTVYITNVNDNNTIVCIYNVLGQEIFSQKLLPNTLNKVNVDLVAGQYIVKVLSNAGITTQKVYLK